MPRKARGASPTRTRPQSQALDCIMVAPVAEDSHDTFSHETDGATTITPAQQAWDVVIQAYPAISNHFAELPSHDLDISFLASQAATRDALSHTGNRRKQFLPGFAIKNAQNRKLKAALAQAAGISASIPCDRCKAGKGLWKTCCIAPTLPGKDEDVFKGACVSCFYQSATTKCTWSASTSTSAQKHSQSCSKDIADSGISAPDISPPPKRRKLSVGNGGRGSKPETKRSIMRFAEATVIPTARGPSIEPKPSLMQNIKSDLEPEDDPKHHHQKHSNFRPANAPDRHTIHRSTSSNDIWIPLCDGNIFEPRPSDENLGSFRLRVMTQERDEYRSALQQEKAKNKLLGQNLLSINSTILFCQDEKHVLQQEVLRLRKNLKYQEVPRASTIDSSRSTVDDPADTNISDGMSESEVVQGQFDPESPVPRGEDDRAELRDNLSLVQAAKAEQASRFKESRKQDERLMGKFTAKIKKLNDKLAVSRVSAQHSKAELVKAQEKCGRLEKDALQSLHDSEVRAQQFMDQASALNSQLRCAEEDILNFRNAAQNHFTAEEKMRQTIEALAQDVRRTEASCVSAEKEMASMQSKNRQLQERTDDIEKQLARSSSAVITGQKKLEAIRLENANLRTENENLHKEVASSVKKTVETLMSFNAVRALKNGLEQEIIRQKQMTYVQQDEADRMATTIEDFRTHNQVLSERLSAAGKTIAEAELMIKALQVSEALLKQQREAQGHLLQSRENEALEMASKLDMLESLRNEMASERDQSFVVQKAVAEELREVFATFGPPSTVPKTAHGDGQEAAVLHNPMANFALQ